MANADRKVALVTGGATGIGRACALQFARHGFDVAINYSRSETEARETKQSLQDEGADAIAVQADVSQADQVANLIATVNDHFGRLDVLVNNAATTNFIDERDLDAMTEDKWDRIFAVNVKGSFFCSRAAVALLRENGGAIVNVSSVAGISGNGSSIAYSASKGALNTLTKTLARTLAPAIRVNAVLPGPVDSRWLRESMTDEEIQELAADWPLPRPVHPNDVADTVFYLATQTQHTTGQLLVLDGGRTM